MQRLTILAIAATAILAACDSPISVQDEASFAYEMVLTQGVTAPPDVLAAPMRPLFSTLGGASASLGGSATTPLSLNGTACTEFPVRNVTISYTVDGRQLSPASFDVYSSWDYDGSSFVGSNATTVNVAAKSTGTAVTYTVDITVENSSGIGVGSSSFEVAPFNLETDTDDPGGQQLSIDASSTATIHVEFADCAAANTPPTLVLPADMTVEATSASGAELTFTVTATDAEDGGLTDDVSCAPSSGSTFALGTTTVNCSVTDSGGLTAQGSFDVTVRDTTPPEFTSIPTGTVTLVAADLNGLALDLASFGIVAEDVGDVSPPVSVSCSVADDPADGYQVGIGQTVKVTCTATDSSEHPSPNTSDAESFDVFVGLDLESTCGFGPPLRNAAPFSAHKRNSAIPHKVCAPSYADGSLATDLAGGLKLVVRYVGTGNPQEFDSSTDEDLSAGSTVWRWDADDEHYIFNAKTSRAWNDGAWETEVSFAGIVLGSTNFQLRR